MKLTKIFQILILFSALVISCGQPTEKVLNAEQYAIHIAEWDSARLQRLKEPTGWVNLAGLFWLQEGESTIGSAVQNEIIYPRGPESIGTLILNEKDVWFNPSASTATEADGEPLSGSIKVFDADDNSVLLTTDSLGFFIIRRGDRYGIRLRDYIHPRLEALVHIDRFTANQDWIIKARFIEQDEDITVRVPDVLGEINEERVPGILEFEFDGEIRRLYPTGSRDRLFIIFADDTNALESYGGGRFLYTDGPDSEGIVYMDFNKAYNPPCAFSPFATCPLPPAENFLPFGITAGEKAVHY